MTRQENRMGADAPRGSVLVVKDHGSVGCYGFDWGGVLKPLRQKNHDGGDFFKENFVIMMMRTKRIPWRTSRSVARLAQVLAVIAVQNP